MIFVSIPSAASVARRLQALHLEVIGPLRHPRCWSEVTRGSFRGTSGILRASKTRSARSLPLDLEGFRV